MRALLVGERIDTRGLGHSDTVTTNPLTLRIGRDGMPFVFRYGVGRRVHRMLGPRIVNPAAAPETDQVQIVIKPDSVEGERSLLGTSAGGGSGAPARATGSRRP